jgi:anion-transporting  ArsA/GET3 family ATPase
MPRFIRSHLKAGAKVFEGLDRIGKQLSGKRSISETMDEWIRLSERISRFVLDRTTFIVVANPEALVVRHVERLVKTLNDYSVSVSGMVINGVIANADSDTLRSIKRGQEDYVSDLKAMIVPQPAALLPLSRQEIKGVTELQRAGETLCRQLKFV